MLTNLYDYCEIENKNEVPHITRNKASAYEYLVKRFFETYFDEKDEYNLDLFPIVGNLTPDMELSATINGKKFIIVIEIKYIESPNVKGARTYSRRQINKYIKGYEEKYPKANLVPLFITQNTSFNNNPEKYPCFVLKPENFNEIDLLTNLQDIVSIN